MPIVSAEELRNLLDRDLPGTLAPTTAPAEGNGTAPADDKHASKRPDFLTTNDTVIVAERLLDVATYVRDQLGYTYLSDIVPIDYLDDDLFELVYLFYNLEGGSELVIKVRVPRERPQVSSLTPIWTGADFLERETLDLFGISFIGHPYPRRIYMWDELDIYPMRKDFPKQGDKYLGDEN